MNCNSSFHFLKYQICIFAKIKKYIQIGHKEIHQKNYSTNIYPKMHQLYQLFIPFSRVYYFLV